MIIEAMIKGAAVGEIAMLWTKFTLETIKICQRIVFHPKIIPLERCEYCGIFFPPGIHSQRCGINCYFYICKHCAEKEVVCEECQERFLDDAEELEQANFGVKFLVVKKIKNKFQKYNHV